VTNDLRNLGGQVAIVTGGSRGIGAGIAGALADAGAAVTILSRDEASGRTSADEITNRGGGAVTFIGCDVARVDDLRDAVEDVAATHGRLDCLVNNAVTYGGTVAIDDLELELLERMLRTNVVAYFVASKAALPHLRRTGGRIVNVSSLAGELGQWHSTAYCATKGAITAFTRALAIDEAANGVRVNAILPGNIMSDRQVQGLTSSGDPEGFQAYLESWQWMGRIGTVEEVGQAALFLASDMSTYTTGTCLVVSGGLELGVGAKGPTVDFGTRSANPDVSQPRPS
jgi:NAD(P)-dependent dehydrogenase (short-subunit alcohol dehydrogenase family)